MTYQQSIDEIKPALAQAETDYNLAYAAGNLVEAMLLKRKVVDLRHQVGVLIKRKLRRRK